MSLPNKLDPSKHVWLGSSPAMTLLDLLNHEHNLSTRFVGGCVRNALMGEPVADIDLATKIHPEEVQEILQAAGHKAIATGIEHGTITAVVAGTAFEVTTLRKDVSTDGRRADVVFTEDWEQDSQRRDFTFNAIYCDGMGELYDFQGGIKDAASREVHFIGEASERIEEDYLRILRYFRFFAWYGSGRPNREAIVACAQNKDGIKSLSAERVWKELKNLLAAPDPVKALRWMRTAEILQECFPGSRDVDALANLVREEQANNWPTDPLLRFMALLEPSKARAAVKYLKMSNAERSRIMAFANNGPVTPDEDYMDLSRRLYRKVVSGFVDATKIALGQYQERERRDVEDQLDFADEWERPVFPVTAKHLMEAGFKPGKELGDLLWELEDEWITSGFALSMDELRAKIGNLGTGGKSGGQG
jgi:tRNA nucleotidyltransferase/poly(A) polymerase